MEKAAGPGASAGKGWEFALGGCATLVVACLCPAAQAQEGKAGPAEVLVAEAKTEPTVRLQVQASTLPRFDAFDTAFQGSRIDFSVIPLTPGGSGLGPVLGVANTGGGAPQLGLLARTNIDLGLRWTQRLQSQRQIDITAWRRLNNPDDDAYTLVQMRYPAYGARVEMNLSAKPPTKVGLALERGFVGLQLEGGGRITVKRKDGGAMFYYRNTF